MPLTRPGTDSSVWLSAAQFPALDLSACSHLVIVAAHPDDETLGLGATAATVVEAGGQVLVVAVSDGGAGGRSGTEADYVRLKATRRAELRAACRRLQVPDPIFLGLPDGDLDSHEEALTVRLVQLLSRTEAPVWCAATWRGDGHPDHEAVGRAAANAASAAGATLLEYPLWMWHWGRPEDKTIPWELARLPIVTDWAKKLKSDAVQCFQSQIQGEGEGQDDSDAVLPPFVLDRLLAVEELVFVAESNS